jgi:hypothetical protein
MVVPRHVICALGPWSDLDAIQKAVRKAGGPGFLVDHRHSQCEPDPRMGKAFVAAADRVRPSLKHEDHAVIAKHKAVAYVMSPRLVTAEALEISRRMLTVVRALFDAGSVAVKGESSGIAHGAARWKELEARVTRAAGNEDTLERTSALIQAWVRRPIKDGELLYSCGMHLLGEHDVEVMASKDVHDDIAWMDLLAIYLLAERPTRGLRDGEGFRQRLDGERRILRLTTCERFGSEDFMFNPFGYWRLTTNEPAGS